MKKKLLLGAFLMGSILTTQAQTTVWSDNFDDEDVADWTMTDADGDTKNWGDIFQIGDGGGGFITPVSLISRSWEGGVALTPDNWAVSPAIDLTGVADGNVITFSFLRQSNEEFPEDKYTVYVGTSSDIDDLLESTVTFTETPADGAPTTKTMDLSSFAGETIHIAFRHYDSEDMDFISIDDMVVTDEGVAGLSNALSSKFSIYPNPVKDVVNIANVEGLNGVKIVDLNGRTVKSINFSGASEASVNVSDLTAGVYMMNIATEKGTSTQKIVKQ